MNIEEKIHEFEKFGSKLGLERISELLERLGNPEKDLRIIHVAGTNGKGSTCKYIYSVLREAGYKVGLYTSPFLEIFNERVELDGKLISDEELEAYMGRVFREIDAMVKEGTESPTEFEVITAAAFLYYKEKGCDYVVTEVGLGGRLDATNVVENPLISVIASISFDHTDRLGDTLGKIAYEKAGIIKHGVPVVTSAGDDEALDVIRARASELGCDIYETRNNSPAVKAKSLSGYMFDFDAAACDFTPAEGEDCENSGKDGLKAYENLEISMVGNHQLQNAALAVTALEILRTRTDIEFTQKQLCDGLKKAKQIGRFEVMQGLHDGKKPVVIIDGAHNPDGARVLREAMQEFVGECRILIVTGMLKDKDTDNILNEFTQIGKDFIVTEPVNPRKLDVDSLAAKLEKSGASVVKAADNRNACALASERYGDYDAVLFAGSLYLIGAIRKYLH